MSLPPPPPPLRVPVADSHCHLDIRIDEESPDWAGAVAAATEVGVTRVVQVGCDLRSARWSATVAAPHPQVKVAVALHPNEAPRIEADLGAAALEEAYEEIADLAAGAAVTAVGETGLDHYRTGPAGRAVQEDSFRRHIRLAHRLGKPLVIHDRDAHEDVLRVLAEEQAPDTVVFHCFSGDARMARTCAEHGWYLSFAGTVSFRNAEPLREALRVVPRDRLLVETDAPYLTPMPHRGRPNASYLVPLTVRAMASARGEAEDDLAAALWDNTIAVFGEW